MKFNSCGYSNFKYQYLFKYVQLITYRVTGHHVNKIETNGFAKRQDDLNLDSTFSFFYSTNYTKKLKTSSGFELGLTDRRRARWPPDHHHCPIYKKVRRVVRWIDSNFHILLFTTLKICQNHIFAKIGKNCQKLLKVRQIWLHRRRDSNVAAYLLFRIKITSSHSMTDLDRRWLTMSPCSMLATKLEKQNEKGWIERVKGKLNLYIKIWGSNQCDRIVKQKNPIFKSLF